MPLQKVISGGQSGVDRAALDAALGAGLALGGWCPRGRGAEDGPIPGRYALRETVSASSVERTRLNVLYSDATLILVRLHTDPGTRATQRSVRAMRRPSLQVRLADPATPARVRRWLARHHVRVLNIAGPRESTSPGIYGDAYDFLKRLFATP